ncbi:MAG: hypothetical protein OXF77_00830, partial [Thaumarchaeota archaeon]|nr:hypothetical protein [Nitrososphaerota archaeon]
MQNNNPFQMWDYHTQSQTPQGGGVNLSKTSKSNPALAKTLTLITGAIMTLIWCLILVWWIFFDFSGGIFAGGGWTDRALQPNRVVSFDNG